MGDGRMKGGEEREKKVKLEERKGGEKTEGKIKIKMGRLSLASGKETTG